MKFPNPILVVFVQIYLFGLLKSNRKTSFAFFVWVWDKFPQHTWGFGFVCFFYSGYFSFVFWVWEEGLFHTTNIRYVGVCRWEWGGYVDVSIPVSGTWLFF